VLSPHPTHGSTIGKCSFRFLSFSEVTCLEHDVDVCQMPL